MLGTANQITATPDVGTVTIAIDADPQLPGTGSVGLPSGTTAQQAGIAGSIRFNSQTSVFESTTDGIAWDVIETSATGVVSLTGTASQINVSASTGNITISLSNDAVLPGTGGVALPAGNTAQRGTVAGSVRFNSQTNVIELTNDGITWYTVVNSGSSVVLSVSGTANRITSTGGTTPVIDIDANYVGQSSINTVGTISSGIWNGTVVDVSHGGTGVATMTTAYAPVISGTTATGTLQVASTGLSTAGYVLTSNGASAVPSFQAPGGGALTTVTVNIPLADFLVANVTPYTLVADPGAGNIIIVTSVILKIVIGGVVFVSGAGTLSRVNNTSAMVTGNIVSVGPTTYYFLAVQTITPSSGAFTPVNYPIQLSNDAAYTGGTGSTIDATVTYYTIAVP